MTLVAEARPTIDPRSILGPDIWALLAEDVRKKNPCMSAELADRGVGQMVAFLVACTRTDEPLGPSKLVDEFWHAFILRTEPYAEFGQRVAGYFIHHVPTDSEPDGDTSDQALMRTFDAITAAGFTIDPELWPSGANCSQCHQGCTDSPNSGKGKK